MATEPAEESLVQLCGRATRLGNNISGRMVEFLNTVKHQPLGFRDLGYDFLDICRIMTAIEASLAEFIKSSQQQFPPDVLAELDRKFRQTVEDFLVLDQLLQKFLDYEKGGAAAMVQKTWRRVFADKDIAKVQNSLRANRDTLKMSMLVFSWAPNYQALPTSAEYRTLEAELERQSSLSDAATVSSLTSPTPSELEGTTVKDDNFMAELDDTGVSVQSQVGAISVLPLHVKSGSELPADKDGQDAPGNFQDTTGPVDEVKTEAKETQEETSNSGSAATAPVSKSSSSSTRGTKPDPSKMKRRQPANPQAKIPAALQSALVSAVQGKRHTIVEQLLNRGVPPNTTPPKVALLEATKLQDVTGMQLLLEFGADPDAATGEDNTLTPLCSASENGFTAGAELLLLYGASPDAKRKDGWSPLCMAINNERAETAAALLEHGADPNQLGPERPLVLAVKRGLLETVDRLLAHGADPDGKNPSEWPSDGASPLCTAVDCGRADAVDRLLARGAGPNLLGPKLPLWAALAKPELLKRLVEAGADVHTPDGIVERGVSEGSLESVAYLLSKGADPNAKYTYFRPLTSAIHKNRPDLVELVLSNGADPNMEGWGWPLREAVNSANPRIIEIMLDAGADPKIPQVKGTVELAVQRGALDCLKVLISKGKVSADERHEYWSGMFHSPLVTAVRLKNMSLVRYLIEEAGANLNNVQGETLPLTMAVRQSDGNDTDMIAYLLSKGADTNARDSDQRTALMEAVEHNKVDVVRLLLEKAPAKVDPDITDGNGRTALDIAANQGHDELVGILLEAM